MCTLPFIFPFHIFYSSFPLLYDSDPDSPNSYPDFAYSHPYSLLSHPDSPHSHHFHPDSRISIILLILFPDSPFRLLQITEKNQAIQFSFSPSLYSQGKKASKIFHGGNFHQLIKRSLWIYEVTNRYNDFLFSTFLLDSYVSL